MQGAYGEDPDLKLRLTTIYLIILALVVSVIVAVPASLAKAGPWWPTFDYREAGTYCAPDVRVSGTSRGGPRAPRTGSIVVRSFEAPLFKLPTVRRLPRSGHLPFGPPTVTIRPSRVGVGDRLRVGGGKFGYALVNHQQRSTVPLQWSVVTKMHMLGAHGRPVKTVSTSTRSIHAIAAGIVRRLLLPTSSVPGVYRFDLLIRSEDGRNRVRYQDYVRVLAPVLDVRLGSNSKAYAGGDIVFGRLENLGTQLIRDLPEYRVERQLADSTWQGLGPRGLGWPRSPAPLLGAGKARCLEFRVPNDATPGRYRIVKQIEYDGSSAPGQSILTREFEVHN
jgi:hypothetical protein